MSEAPPYFVLDAIALDKDGGHYSYWVSRLTEERLHEKSQIATVLAWYRHELSALREQLEAARAARCGHHDDAAKWRCLREEGHEGEHVFAGEIERVLNDRDDLARRLRLAPHAPGCCYDVAPCTCFHATPEKDFTA